MVNPDPTSNSSYGVPARSMSPDQFDQIVQAIIEGKYSWACVLMLRSAGYNPAHYIPYRTYKRLVKDNRPKSARPITSTTSSTSMANADTVRARAREIL